MHRLLLTAFLLGCGSPQPQPVAQPTGSGSATPTTAKADPGPPQLPGTGSAEGAWTPPKEQGPLIKPLPPPDAKPLPPEVMTAFTEFKDRVCACPSEAEPKACVEQVSNDMASWAMQHQNEPWMTNSHPDEAVMKLSQQMAECYSKIYNGP
jgi:hypothetical protein